MRRLASRALKIWRLPTLHSRFSLLYLTLAKRLTPPKDFSLSLGERVVYLGAQSLPFDYATLFQIFCEEYYRADYRDAVVIDIGAHKGYYATYVLLNGALSVCAYEPEQGNFAYLQRSARSFCDDSSKWHIHNAAVGSRNGQCDLNVSVKSWSHSQFRRSSDMVDVKKVPMVAMHHVLDEACREHGSRLIVKMNVEGAECDIILGTPVESWRRVDEVFVAFHSFAPCSQTEIKRHLAEAGLESSNERFHDHSHFRRHH